MSSYNQDPYQYNPDYYSSDPYEDQGQSQPKAGTQTGFQGPKSSGSMPYLNQRGKSPLKPKRTKEEHEQMFHHLIQPTKSLKLRKEVVAQSKKEIRLMHIKNSRVLDNHYLDKVHHLPWIAPGLFHRFKYESDSTGIAVTFPDNAYESILNNEKKELQKLTKDGFRNWNEYEKIRDGEQIITIEYCTNCADHQGTTRHDEKKYEFIASNLKKELLRHFPTIKVFMKPLITEPQERSLDNQYARSRLGAMEVQLCSNKNGKIEKNTLFSKLETKSWPSTLAVLNEVRKYMDKCVLKIRLLHDEFDPENLKEDQKQTSQNKLLNVEVILRPLRRINQSSYQNASNPNGQTMSMSVHGQSQLMLENDKSHQDLTSINSRPNSGFKRSQIRPQSAQSAFTVKSYSQVPQREGFAPNGKSIEIKEKSNASGIVTFTDLPFDVYLLEIKETNNFRVVRDQVDIFKEIKDSGNAQEVIHEVHLENVELTFAKIILDPLPQKDAKPNECLIKIIKQGEEDNELESKIIREFETTLDPGMYTIIVSHPMCGTIHKEHEFSFGNQELKITWEEASPPENNPPPAPAPKKQALQSQSQKSSKRPTSARPQSGNQNSGNQLNIQVIDYINQREFIDGCKIEIKDEIKGDSEHFTNEEGVCQIRHEGFTKGSLRIAHNDYLEINEEYGPTGMNINKQKDLTFPLIRKPESDNEVNLLMFTDTDKKIMTLHVISPDGISSSTSKKDVIIDNNQGRSSLIKIQRAKETKGVYRIYAKVQDLNLLQPSFLKFYVITSVNSMNFIEVSKTHPTLKGNEVYWDIGALFVPECKFVETNSIQSEPVGQYQHLHALKQIIEGINKVPKRPSSASKRPGSGKIKPDLRNLLGYPFDDPKVLQHNNDFLVQKEQVVSSIAKNMFNGQLNSSIEHLINSALATNGLFSFNKLKSKFEAISFLENLSLPSGEEAVKEVKQEEEEDYDEDDDDGAYDEPI